MDIFAATAAESKELSNSESMKMASRKISLRIVTLYTMTMLTASFVVPNDHPFINGQGQSVGAHSLFIIAAVEAGIPSVAHFFNAIFVFSSFTCAINSSYVASRVLHTLALQGQTGPEFITSRLRRCHNGVPIRAVLVTCFLMLIGYMGRTGAPGQVSSALLGTCKIDVNRCTEIERTCVKLHCFLFDRLRRYLRHISLFLPNVSPDEAYPLFHFPLTISSLEDVKLYGNTSEAQAASYDRNHPRYPYKSHGQWLKAAYGMSACILLTLFNGINAFLNEPFGLREFISKYISVSIMSFQSMCHSSMLI